MKGTGSALIGVPTTARDTTQTAVPDGRAPWVGHRCHRWGHVVGGVVWVAVMIYMLWLATRAVRALERVADKFQGRGS
jgi:hypothetical protein